MKYPISLRQNKILQLLRSNNRYMTSSEIADYLSVSSKTVRTDISDINRILSPEGIFIDSVKSKGFILVDKKSETLLNISKDSKLFFGRSDRVYYLSVRLCTSDTPIDLYDLETEMSVSSSTLNGDIAFFKGRFVTGFPNITLTQSKNTLFLEQNELKRRSILTKLLSDNWDYNSTADVYYECTFIDSDVFNHINSNVGRVLFHNHIHLEDYSLVSLNLYLSIAHSRVNDGHLCSVSIKPEHISANVLKASEEFFSLLEEEYNIRFPLNERLAVAKYIESSIPKDYSLLSLEDLPKEYCADAIKISDIFTKKVFDTFSIDLSEDEHFYIFLVDFISQLLQPHRDFTIWDTFDSIKDHYFLELDIALLIKKIMKDEGYNISETEIFYLTYSIHGTLARRLYSNPEKRLNAILISHMDRNAVTALEIALKNEFGGYLNIQDVIPVNHKDFYDFSNTDIILSTVSKNISRGGDCEVIQISPYMTKDDFRILGEYLRHTSIRRFFSRHIHSFTDLLKTAFVHERMTFTNRSDLILFMCQEFIDAGIFSDKHKNAILNRENFSPSPLCPSVVILYSTIPATETKLSVLTLDHRLVWNSYKIRTVYLLSMKEEDRSQLFYLQDIVYHQRYNNLDLKNMKSIEEIREYYKDY